MELLTETFRGHPFIVARGTLHPGYSFETFNEERDLREQYWDIQPDDVVVDAGASYGAYTLSALAAGATVVAFEPEPLIYFDLLQNIYLNAFSPKATALNMGLWSQTAHIPMQSYAPHWPAHTISHPYLMTTLDAFVARHHPPRLDWLKIDVEGAEEHVIKGALQTIRRFRPNILIECHTFLDTQIPSRVSSLLHSFYPNYTIAELERPPCATLLVTRP